jgi:hypothetical protein
MTLLVGECILAFVLIELDFHQTGLASKLACCRWYKNSGW